MIIIIIIIIGGTSVCCVYTCTLRRTDTNAAFLYVLALCGLNARVLTTRNIRLRIRSRNSAVLYNSIWSVTLVVYNIYSSTLQVLIKGIFPLSPVTAVTAYRTRAYIYNNIMLILYNVHVQYTRVLWMLRRRTLAHNKTGFLAE